MDRRLTPCNGRVAAAEIKGQVAADRYVTGDWRQCHAAVAGLHASPQGALSCQLLFGDRFRVLESAAGWSFGQSGRDGYVGYVKCAALGECAQRTHRIVSTLTHAYPEPDMKTEPLRWLPYGARIAAKPAEQGFVEASGAGFVPLQHVCDGQNRPADHVLEAKKFLFSPYLWGGNGPLGMDCSGLVQLVLHAVGRPCPRDSDMQLKSLGNPVNDTEIRKGDLAFWTGHVGIVCNDQFLLHANAHTMSVAIEPIGRARARIAASKEAEFLGFKRL